VHVNSSARALHRSALGIGIFAFSHDFPGGGLARLGKYWAFRALDGVRLSE
jgi:hypothetical protein